MMKFTWLILLLVFVTELKAQDPILSQYYTSSSAMNPALSSMFLGQYKANLSYRNQWYSLVGDNSYKTSFVSFDYKFESEGENTFALGGMLLSDNAGEGTFRQNRAHLTASYNMQLSAGSYGKLKHYLAIGSQFGFGQNSIEPDGLWFPRQFDQLNVVIDTDIPSGEPFPSDQDFKSGIYPDINLGLAWSAINGRLFSSQLGFSMSHINQPLNSVYGSINNRFKSRYTLSAFAQKYVANDVSLLPSAVLHVQGKSTILFIGNSFSYSLVHLGESGFRVGGYMRLTNRTEKFGLEGFILSALYERQNMQIGFSYDFTISGLRLAANALGGVEMSFSFINPFDTDYLNPVVPAY